MKSIIFIIVLLILPYSWAQQNQVNPFESMLPEEEKDVSPQGERRGEKVVVLPESIVVEGVLWGDKSPKTIINGGVYSVGDQLEDFDATVFKIEKNNVFILYSGKIFKEKPKRGGRR